MIPFLPIFIFLLGTAMLGFLFSWFVRQLFLDNKEVAFQKTNETLAGQVLANTALTVMIDKLEGEKAALFERVEDFNRENASLKRSQKTLLTKLKEKPIEAVEPVPLETVTKVKTIGELSLSKVKPSSTPKMVKMDTPPIWPANLQIIEGIGPKIELVLREAGIRTWESLAVTPVKQLVETLKSHALHHIHNPQTWPEQARLASRNEWPKLIYLQKKLKGNQTANGKKDSPSKLERWLKKYKAVE